MSLKVSSSITTKSIFFIFLVSITLIFGFIYYPFNKSVEASVSLKPKNQEIISLGKIVYNNNYKLIKFMFLLSISLRDLSLEPSKSIAFVALRIT